MTTIRGYCPTCGEVDMAPGDVLLMVCNQAPLSYYVFDCPGCAVEVRGSADDRVISLLMSGGVRATIWEVPAEALEAKTGEPISYRDLLAFVFDLDADDRLAARLQPRP